MSTYLAVYTGPGGPISAEFQARDINQARAIVRRLGSRWYDAAADDLCLSPDAGDAEIGAALGAAGWTLVCRVQSDRDYDIHEEVQP